MLALVLLLTASAASAAPSELSFVHLTDLHTDQDYIVGEPSEWFCHHYVPMRGGGGGGGGARRSRGGPPYTPAPWFGTYTCDAPIALTVSALAHAVSVVPQPAFVVFTGDTPPHSGNTYLNQAKVLEASKLCLDLISAAWPGVPLLYAVGNHLGYPQDQIPLGPNWLLGNVSNYLIRWLDDDALRTFRDGGFYSMRLGERLVGVALNTVYWYGPDKLVSGDDPGGQLAWLGVTLAAAASRGDRVLLAGHVPPGGDERQRNHCMREGPAAKLLALMRQWSHVLTDFSVWGHTHADTFKLLRAADSCRPLHTALVAPALAPLGYMDGSTLWTPNNPGVRVIGMAPGSYALASLTQYWTNLTAASRHSPPRWEVEYKLPGAYGLKELTPAAFDALVDTLASDGTLFQSFYRANTVLHPSPSKTCDGDCRTGMLCSLSYVDYGNETNREYDWCMGKGYAKCV